MKSGPLAWAALALWGAWAFALQGLWAQLGALRGWTPELGVVLVIGLASRMTPERARWGAAVLALTRSALSADPLLATLPAYLLLSELVAGLRRTVDTETWPLRTSLAALGGAAVSAWLVAVHLARAGTPAPWALEPLERVMPMAASTAMFSLVLGGWLRRLPGIGPLWRKEHPWVVAAQGR